MNIEKKCIICKFNDRIKCKKFIFKNYHIRWNDYKEYYLFDDLPDSVLSELEFIVFYITSSLSYSDLKYYYKYHLHIELINFNNILRKLKLKSILKS